MPDLFPVVTPYGRPMEQKPAPRPVIHRSTPVPILENHKAQKPLISAMKKMMKMPKMKSGKKATGQRFGTVRLPKPGKKHMVRFY